MPQYRLELELVDRCPVELAERELSVGSEQYSVVRSDGKTIQLEAFDAPSGEDAAACATDVLNSLLNRLCSELQYATTIVPRYQYWNLADPSDASLVVCVTSPAVAYLNPPILEMSVDLKPLPGAAFFRRGNVTTDAFESFRCYYLAVDVVGKRVRGKKGADRRVLEDTLEVITTPEMLSALAEKLAGLPIPPEGALTGDTVKDLAAVLYARLRCSLMHSGADSDLVPFDGADESLVRSALSLMRGVAWQYVKFERRSLSICARSGGEA